MRIAIFGKPEHGVRPESLHTLFGILRSLNDEVTIEKSFFDSLDGQSRKLAGDYPVFADDRFSADAALSIGGDGTFLRTAARIGDKGIPVLGINAGRLGFLADITETDAGNAIRLIHQGRFSIEPRSLLELKMDGMPDGHHPFALNEIAVLKHDVSSMVNISCSVDGKHLTTYMADGLVIATPTGSTAYSLSVGGPVISPCTDVIEIIPVAPHSLTMRPLILRNNRVITLTVESRSRSYLTSVDGRSFSCSDGISMEIRKAPFCINVIRPDGCDFFSTLRDKMMWGADSRH